MREDKKGRKTREPLVRPSLCFKGPPHRCTRKKPVSLQCPDRPLATGGGKKERETKTTGKGKKAGINHCLLPEPYWCLSPPLQVRTPPWRVCSAPLVALHFAAGLPQCHCTGPEAEIHMRTAASSTVQATGSPALTEHQGEKEPEMLPLLGRTGGQRVSKEEKIGAPSFRSTQEILTPLL